MEPPGADVRGRATPGDVQLKAVEDRAEGGTVRVLPWSRLNTEEMRTGAGAGAAALSLSSTGEVVLLAVLLGAAAGEILAAAVAMLATIAVALRWGTTSLDAVAGAQAVLGPAGAVGPVAAAASTWCAALALILVKARGLSAMLFGLTAGLVVMGPSGAIDQLGLRVVAAALGAALAVGAQRWAPPIARPVALGLGAGAVLLAALS